jgi:hypothetical protein
MSDRDLAKVMTEEEKEKNKKLSAATGEKAQDRPKKKPVYKQRYPQQWAPQQPWMNPAMGFQYGAGYGNPQFGAGYPPSAGFPPRPEARSCLNCRQPGHLFRQCPNRAPAALGVAPK